MDKEIEKKKDYNRPYYAYHDTVQYTPTDMDHFPYTRFFRGVYYTDHPIVFNRKAGYRVIDNQCYRKLIDTVPSKVNYCWERPCSTVTPCSKKEEDKKVCIATPP